MPETTEEPRGKVIARRALLALPALVAAWAGLVAVSGGIDLRPYGIFFKSTDVDRPLALALILAAAYVAAFRAHAQRQVESLHRPLTRAATLVSRFAPLVAAACAIMTFSLGMYFGVHVAGGSDSWGYVSQADLWRAGDLIVEQKIATEMGWPDADSIFAPLGYRPGLTPGAIVPVYAPGLPVQMALGQLLLGACGTYVVVPLLGALTVWLTYVLGVQIGSPLLGALAALLMASSPAFLFMLMNPMSDVPVAAWFTAGLVSALSSSRWRALWTGIAVSVAIFVRPNLVPVGIVFLVMVVVRAAPGRRLIDAVWFCIGGLPLTAAVAVVNTYLYGAPWKSGYGGLDQFYSLAHVGTNLAQYTSWFVRTETPLILLSLGALVAAWRSPARSAMVFLGAFVAAIWVCYLAYNPFDAWWYLRFLLPAFPPMLVGSLVVATVLLRRTAGHRWAVTIGFTLAVVVGLLRLNTIREEAIFSLWLGGVTYVSTGEYVRQRLPENAVILTVQHSGSIRHYGHRPTARWDMVEPEAWRRMLDDLRSHGYHPYLLVASFEEKQLRARFNLSQAGDAPGSIVAELQAPERAVLYDPLRIGSAAGESIPPLVACPCGSGMSPWTRTSNR